MPNIPPIYYWATILGVIKVNNIMKQDYSKLYEQLMSESKASVPSVGIPGANKPSPMTVNAPAVPSQPVVKPDVTALPTPRTKTLIPVKNTNQKPNSVSAPTTKACYSIQK
jgi:hypothetical protein